METIYLGWSNGAYYEVHDAYLDGYCQRCGRKRTDCQAIIDSGKRCTEKLEANARPVPRLLAAF